MTISRAALFVSLLTLLAGISARAMADESWHGLMAHAPAEANALVMVDADKVRRSKFAKDAGWNSADRAVGGLRSILPGDEIRRVVFAARLNMLDLSPHWEAGVFETTSERTLESFLPDLGAPTERLGTTHAARLPFNAYILKLEPRTFGLLAPADRQQAARWARSSAATFAAASASTPADPKPLTSGYLTKIASFPETIGTEIMLGLDLTDAVDVAAVRRVLGESSLVRDAKLDPSEAAEIVASIEGIALGVRVLDQATGMIRVDFTRDPAPLAKVLKPLLLERLAARGAMIEDFSQWKLDLQGNTAFLGGKLSPGGLSLILSIVEPELPAVAEAASQSAESPSTKQAAQVIQKSRRHFMQVSELVTEIRFPTMDMKTTAFGTWIDRQARRIDQLPVLDVDPELLDYSQGVAKSLRVTASKQRGAAIRSSANARNTGSYGYNYNGRPTETDSRIQGRMESSAANLEHVDIMRMIDDETAAIRRKMTERYHVEF